MMTEGNAPYAERVVFDMKSMQMRRNWGRLTHRVGTILSGAAFCVWSVAIASAQSAVPVSANVITVHGVVRDLAGKPVPGAAVRLERRDRSGGMDARTGADGTFAIPVPPGGVYVATAQKGGLESRGIEVSVDPSKDEEASAALPIVLVIGAESTWSTDAKAASPQGMEFSDSPSFTIAAVTDWTAAGGHGSDAILRTSESLTRDTVQMKRTPGGAKAPADPALKQALALEEAGDYARARHLVGDELAKGKSGDALRLAGELDEKLGDPVAAVNEFEQAVKADGSEENYFQWGSELLLHRAIWQAKDVFTAGAQRYPKSARMLTALGAALFASSLYDEAAQKLCQATDLSPESEEPYQFLGKAELASPNPLRCAEEKLDDFVKRRPENALANYYFAMATWKQSGRSLEPQVIARVEALLKQAVAIDASCGDAYLQLGNLNAAQHENAKAIAYYGKAIAVNPQLAEAHYRLGMAYDRIGERDKAQREFQLHEELDKQQAAEVERQRREVKQFLVEKSAPQTSKP